MNRLSKASLMSGKDTSFSRQKGSLSGYTMPYPLLGVKELSYEGEAYALGKYPHVDISLKAIVSLSDSYDAQAFDQEIELEDSVDILESEDREGDGYIMPGKDFDIDELCVLLIHGHLPIKVMKPGSKAPEEDGAVVFTIMGD